MTTSLDPADAKAYRRRARPITVFGLISCIVGLAGVIDRDLLSTSSAVQALDAPVTMLWLLIYAAGGMLAVVGSLKPRPDIEAAGDWMLVGFCLLNAVAILANRGPVGGGVTAASLLLVAYFLHGRIVDLHTAASRDRRVTRVPVAPGRERRRR